MLLVNLLEREMDCGGEPRVGAAGSVQRFALARQLVRWLTLAIAVREGPVSDRLTIRDRDALTSVLLDVLALISTEPGRSFDPCAVVRASGAFALLHNAEAAFDGARTSHEAHNLARALAWIEAAQDDPEPLVRFAARAARAVAFIGSLNELAALEIVDAALEIDEGALETLMSVAGGYAPAEQRAEPLEVG